MITGKQLRELSMQSNEQQQFIPNVQIVYDTIIKYCNMFASNYCPEFTLLYTQTDIFITYSNGAYSSSRQHVVDAFNRGQSVFDMRCSSNGSSTNFTTLQSSHFLDKSEKSILLCLNGKQICDAVLKKLIANNFNVAIFSPHEIVLSWINTEKTVNVEYGNPKPCDKIDLVKKFAINEININNDDINRVRESYFKCEEHVKPLFDLFLLESEKSAKHGNFYVRVTFNDKNNSIDFESPDCITCIIDPLFDNYLNVSQDDRKRMMAKLFNMLNRTGIYLNNYKLPSNVFNIAW